MTSHKYKLFIKDRRTTKLQFALTDRFSKERGYLKMLMPDGIGLRWWQIFKGDQRIVEKRIPDVETSGKFG